MLGVLGRLLVVLLPWRVRRHVLRVFFGYELHPTARIGVSWVYPRQMVMGAHAYIGHLTVVKGISTLRLEEQATIAHLNWITGFPPGSRLHFTHEVERDPALLLGQHAAITSRHLIDCTNRITIGPFATVAGYRSQFLTHSIDLEVGRQGSHPIHIGAYSFVGTGCIVLGGSRLPDYSVLAAGSVLRTAFTADRTLYAGVPAVPKNSLPETWMYFTRTEGFVA